MRRWLDALPPEVVRGHAQLSASYAWCLVLAGETEGVAERLADAERALADGHDGGPMMGPAIAPQLALLRSQLAGLEGDSATAIAQARLARDLVPAGLPAEAEATLRGTATVLLAFALARAGDLDAAAEAYEAALPDLRAGGNRFATGRAIGDLAKIAITRGDPGRCRPAVRGGARAHPEGASRDRQPSGLGRHGQGPGRARTGRARRRRRPSRPRARHPFRRRALRPARPGDARPRRPAARGTAPATRRPTRCRLVRTASSRRSRRARSRSCAWSPSAGPTARSRPSCS